MNSILMCFCPPGIERFFGTPKRRSRIPDGPDGDRNDVAYVPRVFRPTSVCTHALSTPRDLFHDSLSLKHVCKPRGPLSQFTVASAGSRGFFGGATTRCTIRFFRVQFNSWVVCLLEGVLGHLVHWQSHFYVFFLDNMRVFCEYSFVYSILHYLIFSSLDDLSLNFICVLLYVDHLASIKNSLTEKYILT